MATKKSRRSTTTKPARSRKAGTGARTTGPKASREGPEARPLPAGTVAPDFSLRSAPDHIVSLSEFRGRPVILAFYPADWSPTCGDQLALYNEVLPEFERFGAQLIGISVDGAWCHAAYSQQRHFRFPLLADFEPKGEIARKYGVFAPGPGFSNRALFVIDRSGTIRWSYLSALGVNPGADGILAALESIQSNEQVDDGVRAGGRSSKTTKASRPDTGGRNPPVRGAPAPGGVRDRARGGISREERVR